jgi:hypothetical protein
MDERVDMDLDMRWEQTGAEIVEGWLLVLVSVVIMEWWHPMWWWCLGKEWVERWTLCNGKEAWRSMGGRRKQWGMEKWRMECAWCMEGGRWKVVEE